MSGSGSVRLAESDAEILGCYAVMAQLRPHIGREAFVPRVRLQQEQGYRLAFLNVDRAPVTVAGYRFLEQLHAGRVLYVDDLVTDEARRSGGFGSRMLAWLFEQAIDNACQSLDLDSGVQRIDAHRFYEREGMRLASYHFKRSTEGL